MLEVEAAMTKIFGDNCKGTEALAWAQYFNELNVYEEKVKDGIGGTGLGPPPKVC